MLFKFAKYVTTPTEEEDAQSATSSHFDLRAGQCYIRA